jgi:hypothetical protein
LRVNLGGITHSKFLDGFMNFSFVHDHIAITAGNWMLVLYFLLAPITLDVIVNKNTLFTKLKTNTFLQTFNSFLFIIFDIIR